MVTWGANTVHNIGSGSNASGGGLFGTAAAATSTTATAAAPAATTTTATTAPGGGLTFSSSSTTNTNTATPASGGSGLYFGNSSTTTTTTLPQPLSGGGLLFGSSSGITTSAPPTNNATSTTSGLFGSTSFFGGTPAPAPSSGGLFGNTTNSSASIFGGGGTNTGGGSIFGNTVNSSGGSLFGSPAPMLQPSQQQQPQIPAHAAIQAHMNAYARNEEARVLQRMQTIHQTYTGTLPATDGKSHCFTIPLYDPITEQQRQLQDAISTIVMTTNDQGFMVSSALVAPPKPSQICEEEWKLACIRNPDANHFLPTAVVGAENLLARAILHQEQTNTIQKHMTKIQEAIDHIQQRHGEVTRLLEYATEQHQKQCTRLLKIMKAVEVLRCFNIPLQSAEMEAFQRIRYLKHHIIEEQLVPKVIQLTDALQQQQPPQQQPPLDSNEHAVADITIPMEKQQVWMTILQEHHTEIGKVTEVIQKEQKDLQLIHDRVIGSNNNGSSNNTSKMNIALFQR